jgi:hypothetical protein
MTFDDSGRLLLYVKSDELLNPPGKIVEDGKVSALLYRLSKSGRVDKHFGRNGRIVQTLIDEDEPIQTAQRSDGRIVTIREVTRSSGPKWVVNRYDSRGRPAGSAKTGVARQEIPFPSDPKDAFDMTSAAISRDGSFVLGLAPLNSQPVLLRFRKDGSPDRAFDKNGRLVLIAPAGAEMWGIRALSVDRHGRIRMVMAYGLISDQDKSTGVPEFVASLDRHGKLDTRSYVGYLDPIPTVPGILVDSGRYDAEYLFAGKHLYMAGNCNTPKLTRYCTVTARFNVD